MKGRPPSLEARVLLLALSGVAVLWLAAAVLTWVGARHELDELLDGHLAQAAALLVAQQQLEPEDDHAIDAPLLHRYAPRVAFQVFHDGRLAIRSANAPPAPLVAGADPADGFHTVSREGREWRIFVAHGASRDVHVFVGEQVGARTAILRVVLGGALWPLVPALPLLAFALWLAVRRGLAPLRALGALLAARRPHDLRPVQVERAPAEMQPLTDALNALFARIEALLETERRFTADAAHELRTPIAAVRAQAQVALTATGEGERRHALQSTLAGCDRAAHLVEQLLTLARVEDGAGGQHEQADLAAVARRVAGDLAPQAIGKRQMLVVEAPAPVHVRGDAVLLGLLLRNLVDNAIRYGAPGGRIAVRVHADGGARVTVTDDGPGVDDAALQRLGDRFFRVPGTGEAGSGLGLSIARRIAAVHGAQLTFARAPAGSGLQATLAFAP